ncbi:uncharacterized protein P884DRAFT_253712 [Thermothelomyces heterothallicus CBS 202.75]|uniref:uncharacterized protein n=1 Tax=Thermothelomyces heterothallicus CBS 202.75 TaxID=1149848 RepID=UPI0037433A27
MMHTAATQITTSSVDSLDDVRFGCNCQLQTLSLRRGRRIHARDWEQHCKTG